MSDMSGGNGILGTGGKPTEPTDRQGGDLWETKERPFSMGYRPGAPRQLAGAVPKKLGGSKKQINNQKKSLVVKGRQKAVGTLGEREGSVDYTRLCL